MGTNSQVLMKYRRFSRYVGWVVQVFFVICAAACVALLATGCILAFVPGSAFDYNGGAEPITLSADGVLSYKFILETSGPVNFKNAALTAVFFISVTMAGVAVFWRQIRLVLKSVQDNRPFAPENARRLTVVGVLLLVGSLFVRLGLFIVVQQLVDTLRLENVSANYQVEPSLFLGGFLILILAGVFHYGSLLQQEYDATI